VALVGRDVVETKTRKFVDYADIFLKIFQKILSALQSRIFFEILAFFIPALVISYLQIQQTKNTLNYRSFTKPYRCSIQSLKATWLWPRPSLETPSLLVGERRHCDGTSTDFASLKVWVLQRYRLAVFFNGKCTRWGPDFSDCRDPNRVTKTP